MACRVIADLQSFSPCLRPHTPPSQRLRDQEIVPARFLQHVTMKGAAPHNHDGFRAFEAGISHEDCYSRFRHPCLTTV